MLRSITGLLALTISWTFIMPTPASGQLTPQVDPGQHQVVRGNTLWDLADLFYGNPYDWRRIWDANQDRVDNPDLIYPGQILRIPGEDGQMMEVMVMPGGGVQPEPELRTGPANRTLWYPDTTSTANFDMVRQTAAAVQPEIVYGSPFLVPGAMTVPTGMGSFADFAGAVDSRTPRESARTNDRVFLAFDGTAAPAPGALLQVYAVSTHMIGELGRVARPTGIVRVVGRDGARSIGIVERVYDRMLPDDRIRLLPAYEPRPGVQPAAVTGGSAVAVAGFDLENAEIHGPGDHLFIARGQSDGVAIGDEYTVRMPGTGESAEGRFQIVGVADGSATGRIIALRNAVFQEGVQATLERRMPGR